MRAVFFCDIDGVLNLPDQYSPLDAPINRDRKQVWVEASLKYGRPWLHAVWPATIALPLVRAIDQNKELQPVWLSVWADSSLCWNHQAKTRDWPVGYHLSVRQRAYIKHHLPALHKLAAQQFDIDQKLVAVLYFLRHQPTKPIVWIEDGFAEETRIWARSRPNTWLIDTTEPTLYEYLLAHHEDPDAAANHFLSEFCLRH